MKIKNEKCFVILLIIVNLIGNVFSLFGTGVLDLNILKCMFKKSITCPHEAVDFILYTPTDPRGIFVNVLKPSSLYFAGFKPQRETVFLIHGFNGTSMDVHMRYLRDAYLSRKFNVIMVDWSPLTRYPCYLPALQNTKLVGQCAAQMYAFLTHKGNDPTKITCVGHSLGAHICGMMTNSLSGKQHRIIGLDPARPLIEQKTPNSYRLTRDDAKHVQIIHTNAGTLGQLGLSGTVDFCVNGGKLQPFCKGNPIRKNRCSHFLSVCYLANAIFKHKLFPSVPCPQGCSKFKGLPISDSSLIHPMHIGQDVPIGVTGTYCVQASFAKHCPFND